MLSGDVADRAIGLLHDLSNVSAGEAIEMIQDLLALLPPHIQEVIASAPDPVGMLGELKLSLLAAQFSAAQEREEGQVTQDMEQEDELATVRPRTSPLNVSRMARPSLPIPSWQSMEESENVFDEKNSPSTPDFFLSPMNVQRTSTHLSSPWQASPVPETPLKNKILLNASTTPLFGKEKLMTSLPEWLQRDMPDDKSVLSMENQSNGHADSEGLLPNTSFSFNASSIHPPFSTSDNQHGQSEQSVEEPETPSKALAKKLRDAEKCLQISDERITELEKRLESLFKEKEGKDQEVMELKMREKTFKGSIISMENTIDSLNAQLTEQNQVLNEYRGKVKDVESRYQGELDWKSNEVEDLRALMAKYNTETKELQNSVQSLQDALQKSQNDSSMSQETVEEYAKVISNLQEELLIWKHKKPEVIEKVDIGVQLDPIPVTKPDWLVVDAPTQTTAVVLLNNSIQTDSTISATMKCAACQTETLSSNDDSLYTVLQDFENQLELKKEIEDQVEALLTSTDTLERENTSLRTQLTHIQSQVLETRKLFDKRRQFDAEVDRWIENLKTDLSQTEFVAALSHKDMEATVDTMESLKDRLAYVEEELVIERGRIGLLGASVSRPKADKSIQAQVHVMTTGTYSEQATDSNSILYLTSSSDAKEAILQSDVSTIMANFHPQKEKNRFGTSLWTWIFWIMLSSFVYTFVATESGSRQSNLLALFLTWIDDLIDSSAKEMVLM